MTGRSAPLSACGYLWFAAIGLSATALYFVVALALTNAGSPSAVSSIAAFALSSVMSYVGHRALTFRSSAPHASTAPRFTGWVVLQAGLALLVPAVLTGVAGLPPVISFVAVCGLMPLLSLVVLTRFVFGNAVGGVGERPLSCREVRHG